MSSETVWTALFISRKWLPAVGGMETYSVRLTQALEQYADVEALVLPGRTDGLPPRPTALLVFAVKAALRLLFQLRPAEVLHIGDMVLWPLGVAARLRSRRTRLVLSAHGTDVSYPRRGGAKGRAYGAYLRLGSKLVGGATVIANSSATREVAAETGWRRIAVVPLATDIAGSGATGAHDGSLLFAGRLIELKGCAWFIRNVLPLLPDGTRLRVAGVAWDPDEVRALDDPRVEFLGRLRGRALVDAYRRALCVIVPNIELKSGEYEGFGLVATEAAAAGGVVLAARTGGLVDAIVDGTTGFGVAAGDPDAWVRAIAEVADWDDASRRSFLTTSMAYCRNHYTWDRVARETPLPDTARMANAIRFLALDAILNAGEGHQGVPLGMAEIAATLYSRHLKVDPGVPLWPDRDRVVLSNGHGSMLLYALLHLAGYAHVSLDAVRSFRKLGSVCAGHPEIDHAAGIEITTGLLGQGIASAVGMAVAEARLAARFGDDLVNHRDWAFVSDGCLQEGMGQEAISLTGHLRLGKLTYLWDDNHITDDGDTALSISEDVPARFAAAHWHVEAVDGHDVEAVSAAIDRAIADPRPSLIACRTTIARGTPRLEGRRGGHSAPLKPSDSEEARAALGWEHPAFDIPEDVREDWRSAMARGGKARRGWDDRLAAHPEREAFPRWSEGRLPDDWAKVGGALARAALGLNAPEPTITSSGAVCDLLAGALPETIVLCADLEAPTNHKRSRAAFTPADRDGSYVHCGVREHLMGAMANGIAAHGGLRPVTATYLAFTDYERAAMRMAALMGLPEIFVFSHDSIGIGSNGPTHQPVEILAGFRAMPNINVFRPADAMETAEAWQIALETRDRPSLLALSRQAATPVRRTAGDRPSRRGAYVASDPQGERAMTLLATGTEVGVATSAQVLLREAGIEAAVVSMPCWELFEEQGEMYRAEVLGDVPRIGIEAAVRFGWDRWLRPQDRFVGMTGFGASARTEALYEHFGITPARVVAIAREVVGR